jgi:hypothetical protein
VGGEKQAMQSIFFFLLIGIRESRYFFIEERIQKKKVNSQKEKKEKEKEASIFEIEERGKKR